VRSLAATGLCYPDMPPELQTHLEVTPAGVSVGTCNASLDDCAWLYSAPAQERTDGCFESVSFTGPDDYRLFEMCPRNPPWMTASATWRIGEREVRAEIHGQRLTSCVE